MTYPTIDPSSLPQNDSDNMKQQLFAALMQRTQPQGGVSTPTSSAANAVQSIASAYGQKMLRDKLAAQRADPLGAFINKNNQWASTPVNPTAAPAPAMPQVGPQAGFNAA